MKTDHEGKPLTYWGGKENETKQSSIEKLFDEIFNISFKTPEAEDLYCEIMDLKEKYKQMHKQEIIEARNDGFDSTYAEYGETPKCYLDGSSEQYYNKRFKSE